MARYLLFESKDVQPILKYTLEQAVGFVDTQYPGK